MFTFRDLVFFSAGAAFFHTISHILLIYFIPLPWVVGFVTLTQTINFWIIIVSLLLSLSLLWWGSKLPR